MSLFEPINRLMYPEPPGRFLGYDVRAVDDLAAKVATQFAADPDAHQAMMGFDDRDLVSFALNAGFAHVRVETVISVAPGSVMSPVSFDALLGAAPNPNAPTVPRPSRRRSDTPTAPASSMSSTAHIKQATASAAGPAPLPHREADLTASATHTAPRPNAQARPTRLTRRRRS